VLALRKLDLRVPDLRELDLRVLDLRELDLRVLDLRELDLRELRGLVSGSELGDSWWANGVCRGGLKRGRFLGVAAKARDALAAFFDPTSAQLRGRYGVPAFA
jgi:hypothetical protein